MTAVEENPGYKWVGTRPIRHDGFDKVVGKARFAADLNLPGQLHGAFVRSPHAHAKVVSINTAAAEAMPGVKAVVTGDDFPALDPKHPNFDVAVNCMARGEAFYNGHAIAAVAANTREEAKAAAAAIQVEYEMLPAILSISDSMAAEMTTTCAPSFSARSITGFTDGASRPLPASSSATLAM